VAALRLATSFLKNSLGLRWMWCTNPETYNTRKVNVFLLPAFGGGRCVALCTVFHRLTANHQCRHRLEIHSIETLTLTDHQFLLGAKDGTPTRRGPELPPGTGPHSRRGSYPRVRRRKRKRRWMGAGVQCNGHLRLHPGHIYGTRHRPDDYRPVPALQFDPTQIAVMGFSKVVSRHSIPA
jgi:hypothetical protein